MPSSNIDVGRVSQQQCGNSHLAPPLGNPFDGAPIGSLCFIELCAGCARLSLAMSSQGFKATAIDQKSNRHKQKFPTVCLDLADDDSVRYLLTLLKQPGLVFYLHAAPPCGTASRAREKKISWKLKAQGVKEPKPLRSELHPLGVPGLSGSDLRRVTTANSIYRNVARVCRQAMLVGAYVSIENPSRSYLWMTKWMQDLIKEFGLIDIQFQQCMWGGERDKWSSFYTNAPWLQSLRKMCDGNHTHKPWGVSWKGSSYSWNTAQEAEYPTVLCDHIAQEAKRAAIAAGAIQTSPEPPKQKKRKATTSLQAAAAGRQPRGNKFPELIAEFKYTLETNWLSVATKTPRMLTPTELNKHAIPNGKLLSIEMGENDGESTAKIGVYRSCEEFIEQAIQLQHPFDNNSMVSDDIKCNIFELFTKGCKWVDDIRQATLKHYEGRKQALSEAEGTIHEGLAPGRAEIVREKAFLLLEEMCRDAEIGDAGLLDLQVLGTSLVGVSGTSPLFEEVPAQPSLTVEPLMRSSRWSRRMLMGRSTQQSTSVAAEEAVWKGALDEVEKGWLVGPLSEEQVVTQYGPLYVASPRFGLQQSDKVRAIDDMSISLVNSSFAVSYKLDLDGVDGISVLAKTMLDAVDGYRKVKLTLSNGKVLEGRLHNSFSIDQARDLCGRTLDLEAAYKQMLVRESSMWASILLVSKPGDGKKMFASKVLPFGASASVYSFNRIARAIHMVGVRIFKLVWTNYFDDYPQLDVVASGDSSQSTAESLLKLIGWKFSEKENKRCPMSKTFGALGVEFDLSNSRRGEVLVANKQSRVDQVCGDIDNILETASFPQSVASTLRGRLQFAESQTFGRAVSLFMKSSHSRATGSLSGSHLSDEIKEELHWAKDFMRKSPPRKLLRGASEIRNVIFTDAFLSDDDKLAGVGTVHFRVDKNQIVKRSFFSERVPEDVLSTLQKNTPKVIAALELLASVQAVSESAEYLDGVRTFIFVDNEAARANLISMTSPIVVQSDLLRELHHIMSVKSMYMWVSRVPSLSNPADEP